MTKLQFQNLSLKVKVQKYTWKSWPILSFNIVTKIQVKKLYQASAPKSQPNCRQHIPRHQHQQHKQYQEVLSCHLQRPESHQSCLLNSSESVSDKGSQWSDLGPIKINRKGNLKGDAHKLWLAASQEISRAAARLSWRISSTAVSNIYNGELVPSRV